jgi:hypothetical protein
LEKTRRAPLLTERDALVIAAFCIFLAGVTAGRRDGLSFATLIQITSPFYATAFLVMSATSIGNNYGMNANAVIALLTVFLSGSAGEIISKAFRGR